MNKRPPETNKSTAADVVALYTELESLGIKIWIDGGWGVDALLGKQTCEDSSKTEIIRM